MIIMSLFSAKAQWVELNTGTAANLNGIQFVDENHGFCIGESGVFLSTTDGGDSWTKKTFFTAENFQGLHFIDANRGFICSDNHIYKTTDGGANFIEITYLLLHPDTPSKVMDNISVEFTNNTGIITAFWNGDTSISLKTIDHGSNWNGMIQPQSIYYREVAYSIINDQTIYAERLGKQYKTINGGNSWTLIRDLPYTTVKDRGFKVFNEDGVGYASCEYGQPFVCFFSDLSDTMTYYGMYPPESYSFIDTSVGFYLWNNKVYKTTNRGIEHSIIYEFPKSVKHIFFLNNKVGFVCGNNGLIYKTSIGGTSSINNPSLKKKLKIFPNPTSNIINIEYNNSIEIQCIQLVDMFGKEIKSFKRDEKTLNVSAINKGVYFLNVQTKNEKLSEKIIIK